MPNAADTDNVPANKVKLVPIEDYVMSFSQSKKCKELLAEALFESCGGVSLAFVETPKMQEFLKVRSTRWATSAEGVDG